MISTNPERRFPYRATLSAAASSLSLCAFALLLSRSAPTGPRPAGPLIVALTATWLTGAGVGVLLFLWSRRQESRLPVGIAGLLALATGFTLAILH